MLSTTIATELKLRPHQVAAAIELLDDGATIPFIARYRKEATGGLDEEQLRQIETRLDYLRKLEARKATVRAEIESQGKLTPDLDAQLRAATTLQQVEDLYRPFKPKRRTRAAMAREMGLEPLAEALLAQDKRSDPAQLAGRYVNDEDRARCRSSTGRRTGYHRRTGQRQRRGAATGAPPHKRQGVHRQHAGGGGCRPEGRYRVYHEFRAPLKAIAPHQWLALQRGEADDCLKVRIEGPDDEVIERIAGLYLTAHWSPAETQVQQAVADGYQRLLKPAVDRDLRGGLSEEAADHAIQVFATNLRNLLLQPPLRRRAVMGIDPGFRTGCKVATVSPSGRLLHTTTIYPHPPQRQQAKSAGATGQTGRVRQNLGHRHRQRHRQPGNRNAGGRADP